MAAYQVPPSLGFSRQEHWSGLPFPSPVHESEKWKGSRSVVSDPQWSHESFQAPPSMGFSRQEYYCLSNNCLRVAPLILKYQKFQTLLMSVFHHTYIQITLLCSAVSFMDIPLLSPQQSSEQRLGFLFFVSTIAIAGQKRKKKSCFKTHNCGKT